MKALLCCLSRHRKWTPQKSQENPGRQITNKLSWRKERLVMSQISVVGNLKVATVSHSLTADCLWICVFSVSWEQVYRRGVAVVAFSMINLEEKKKKDISTSFCVSYKMKAIHMRGWRIRSLWQYLSASKHNGKIKIPDYSRGVTSSSLFATLSYLRKMFSFAVKRLPLCVF